MSRSSNQSLIDRVREALSTLLGRPAKPAPAYAPVPVRSVQRRITAFSMDAIPRTTRAQYM
ncbi:MAG: hypothetical protein QOF33_540, partial [Thermomicrobiales bacterium]|nr:hypothetical protein [Thermomicrobiales bacterium]